ncbi:glucose-6-phosphate dehydrogenase [Frigoribacterium sp. MCBA15_019]|uniref:glucose-6-phosphate dehydrogenase n=1 Tax=unclassified Frigoribacterium TaxID=2627005 RepID=UPI0008DDB5F7|nr:glucose-6-phosphate dehydrogenase [Frigoribacterium sp. MCBA15_019]OII23586.1 glucose-6-phosphate dehydrogenase [Frigoribacterium sp. MCBA15_019]
MSAKKAPEPATLLILGASGDLAARLLMPGLGGLLALEPKRRVQLIGAGVEEYTDAEWKARVKTSFDSVHASGPAVDALLESTTYITADVTGVDGLRSLVEACDAPPSIYFALPPAITEKACAALRKVDLPEGTSLALEKPFGTDLASAKKLNQQVLRLVHEDQVHRVDHFLGRSTVLNLLGLRFANRLIEPMLNNQHVESIEIVYDEELGLENRARYYDHAGAMVDMIQSHLLQVMAVLTMNAPATLGPADLRDEKELVLRATHVWDDDAVANTRRARYGKGKVDDRTLPAYVDEDGVDPSLETETLAEVVVEVANWRWAGVPILLRSGKALASRRREIVITFRPPTHVPKEFVGGGTPDRLRIAISPDEMSLELNVNGPGDSYDLSRASLHADFGAADLTAYGEVLEGILDDDPTLSVRGDSAEEGWRIVAPVVKAWKSGEVAIDEYPAGSAGPSSWPAGVHQNEPAVRAREGAKLAHRED